MRRRGVCIFCGRAVVQDDEAQAFAHDDPVCEKFAALHANADEVRDVKPEATDAHLDALSRRVAAKRSGA